MSEFTLEKRKREREREREREKGRERKQRRVLENGKGVVRLKRCLEGERIA